MLSPSDKTKTITDDVRPADREKVYEHRKGLRVTNKCNNEELIVDTGATASISPATAADRAHSRGKALFRGAGG